MYATTYTRHEAGVQLAVFHVVQDKVGAGRDGDIDCRHCFYTWTKHDAASDAALCHAQRPYMWPLCSLILYT